MITKYQHTHPISFDEFYAEYLNQLGADDRPTVYMAYVRTEAHFATDDYPRRYINLATFQASASRFRRRARENKSQQFAL